MDLFLAVMCGGDEGLGISGFVKLRVAWVVGFCGFSSSHWCLSMATAELVLCKELLKCKYQTWIIEICFFPAEAGSLPSAKVTRQADEGIG